MSNFIAKKPTIYGLVLATSLFWTACKDKTEPKADILGKWNVIETTGTYTRSGSAPVTDRETFQRGEFTIDFRANGTLIVDDEEDDPEPWRRISETQIEIDDQEYDIRELTSSTLVFGYEESFSDNGVIAREGETYRLER
ncbi:MAG: hypothetical protein MUD08_08865 [Cytophagales bacterium]|jgi:hypothetical protein|nr:hypothetical protein [Cytophagales bacterium]